MKQGMLKPMFTTLSEACPGMTDEQILEKVCGTTRERAMRRRVG